MRSRDLAALALVTLQTAACSSASPPGGELPHDGGTINGGPAAADASPSDDAGLSRDASATVEAGSAENDAAAAPIPAAACDGGLCIQHLVIIVQENHTFDDHFGGYCTATTGSNPTCTDGSACCEAMPATDPSGTKPTVLTDSVHAASSPNHAQSCELSELDNGKMDMFVNAAAGCGSPGNVAIADPAIIDPAIDPAIIDPAPIAVEFSPEAA